MRKFIEWEPKFDTGISSIDKQHAAFLTLANKLTSLAENETTTNADLVDCTGLLYDYIKNHFKTEERFFAQTNYPETAHHTGAHAAFRDIAREFIARIAEEKEPRALAREMAMLSLEWFANHVRDMDQQYVKHFISHGIK